MKKTVNGWIALNSRFEMQNHRCRLLQKAGRNPAFFYWNTSDIILMLKTLMLGII